MHCLFLPCLSHCPQSSIPGEDSCRPQVRLLSDLQPLWSEVPPNWVRGPGAVHWSGGQCAGCHRPHPQVWQLTHGCHRHREWSVCTGNSTQGLPFLPWPPSWPCSAQPLLACRKTQSQWTADSARGWRHLLVHLVLVYLLPRCIVTVALGGSREEVIDSTLNRAHHVSESSPFNSCSSLSRLLE